MQKLASKLVLAAMPFVGACGISDVVATPDSVDLFVQSLDLQSLESSMISGPAQVEVVLLPGGLTAKELAVRPYPTSGEERVQSRAVAISADAFGGLATLLLGELEVGFDQTTRFWIGGDEVAMEAFIAEVGRELEAGREPPIVAERAMPSTPQDPDDGSFVAAALAVTGDGTGRLRLAVDADNLELLTDRQDGDPDAWLHVLGLRIQLRISDGTTDVESHEHEFEHVEEFEGAVRSVDLGDRTLTLTDGTLVRVSDRTQVASGEALIHSLEGVAEALAAGSRVLAWGKGAVESEEPLALLALKIAFAQREPEEPRVVEFEGVVVAVSPEAGTFELADGTVARVADDTEVVAADDHSPSTLVGVAAALEDGRKVVAWGKAEVESEEPLVLEALRVVFKAHEPDLASVEFEGTVARVIVEEGTVVLASGAKIRLTGDTEVVAYHDHSPHGLEDIAAALERGRIVRAWGYGTLESEDPLVIVARRIVLKTAVEDFESDVARIDVEAGTVVLESGWLLQLTETTSITAADDASPSTLAGAAEVLGQGDRVRVWGWGFVTGEEPVSLELLSLTIRRIPVG
ncbi:MAG: hypothetical protein OEN56_03245 [Gemmatimonadota bacterium]|nr:hypothetical protein [Gemmatimonadota bacterium]